MDPPSPAVDDYENRLQIFPSLVETSHLYVCRWSQPRTVLILRVFSRLIQIQLRVIGRGNAINVFYDAYRLRIWEFDADGPGGRINSPIWYLLLPDDRPLRVWPRGPDGMLLSCVTIVGQRVTSVLWVPVRYEHIWTHAHGDWSIDAARSGILPTRCLNLINSLMRSRYVRRANSYSKPD